jgi:ribosomal protein L40E
VESANAPRKGRSAYQKSVDAQAAGLWPIADEIAPEMTLTPEELELVEFSLEQTDATDATDAAEEMRVQDQPAEPAPAETPWGAPSVPAWVSKNVEPHGQPVVPSPEADWSASEPDLDTPVQPQRILHMPIASPVLPPLTPAPPAHEHTPIVARLLGRHDPRPDGRSAAPSRRSSGRHGQPAGDPWPHVTEWSNRPLENRDWWAASLETEAPLEAMEPEPAWPDAAMPAASAEPNLPEAPADIAPGPTARRPKAPDADARTAAAVRLSAVSAIGANPAAGSDFPPPTADRDVLAPAAQQPIFDLSDAATHPPQSAAPEQPAWPEADQEVLEAIRNRPRQAPERAPRRSGSPAADPQAPARPALQRPTPLGPWPPLGASWPAQEGANAPWPAPEGEPIPAVVAAQQAAAPILAEMWAQSAQEVLNRGSVRVCHRCALPVSTQARYCRRCGTQQA